MTTTMNSQERIITQGLKAMKMRAQQPGGPRWFFNMLGEDLEDFQEECLEAVMDVRRKLAGLPTVCNHKGLNRITIRSCHGTGKTELLAQIAHLWNFTTYGLGVATAPKQDQIKTRLFPRYRAILRKAPEWYRELIKVDAMRVKVMADEDWGLIGETASDPDNLSGYHDKPQLILVDEASGSRLDPMFPVLEGALSTPGSVSVEIGNPTRSSGEFWAHHNKSGVVAMYYRMHVKPTDSRYVSMQWLEALRIKYGEKSPVYKVRGLGEFVEDEENQLISYGWLTDARDQEFEEDGSIPRLVISVDVGAGGIETTVVTAVKFYQSFTLFLRQETHSFEMKTASIDAANAGIEMFERFGGNPANGDAIHIDMNGPGNGAVGHVIKHTNLPVVGFMGGASSDNPKRWRNRRVQSYWAFHDDAANGRLRYHENFVDTEDDWDEYCNELVSIHSRPGVEKVEDLETKEQHVKRTGFSPNRSDSTAIAYTTEIPSFNDPNAPFGSFGTMETAHANW